MPETNGPQNTSTTTAVWLKTIIAALLPVPFWIGASLLFGQPMNHAFIFMLIPVLLAAWNAGFYPGLMAILPATVAAWDLTTPTPKFDWSGGQPIDLLGTGTLIFTGLLVSWTLESVRWHAAQVAAANREARRSEQRLVEQAPAALAMFDTEMRYLACSTRWKTMYGFAADRDLVGCSQYEVLSEVFESRRNVIQRVLAGETLSRREDRFERVDGSVLWVDWECKPWRTSAGAIGGIIIWNEDVTSTVAGEKAAEAALLATSRRQEQQSTSLIQLTRNPVLRGIDQAAAWRAITEAAAQTLQVSRASIWFYDHERGVLRCDDLLAMPAGTHSQGVELQVKDYPHYFDALAVGRILAAHDARTDPRTREFSEGYLKPLGITSMLDAPVHTERGVVGVICCEHIGMPRQWTLDEQNFAASMADFIALSLEACERHQTEESLRASEEKYRSMAESASSAIVSADYSGRIVAWNLAAEQMFGHTAAEAIGQPMTFIIPQHQRADYTAAITRLHRGEPSGHIDQTQEMEGLRKDGCEFPLELSLSTWQQGGRSYYTGIINDITRRKEASLSLRQFRTTVELSHEGVLMFHPDTLQFFYANRAACEQVGYSEAELLQLHPYDLQPEYPEARYRDIIAPLSDGSQPSLRFETIHRHKNGRDVPVQVLMQLIAPPGEPARFVNIVTDITERKAAETAIETESRKVRLLLQTACESIHILNTGGNVLQCSDSFARELGYTNAEALQLNVRDWEASLNPEDIRGKLDELFAAANAVTFETRHRRRDGSVHDVEVNARSVNVDGCPMLYCTSRDISPRKAAEQALRESEQRFRDLFNYAPDAYFIMDSEQSERILACNKAAMEMLGGSAEQILGKTAVDFSPPRQPDGTPSKEAMAQVIKRIRSHGGSTNFEFLQRRLNGDEFWVSGSVSIIYHNRPQELVVWRDITSRKAAETKLQLMLQRLGRSNAELEQFAYVASHDLQEPLRAVSGCAQLIELEYRGKLDPSADELIAHIVEGVSRMQNLIADLLAYSRVSTGASEFVETDLEAVLTVAVQNLSAAIEESKARITHDLLPTLQCDRTQMIQLFQNLLGNAIKFRADRRPEIHISAEQLPTAWKFRIRDNGIGIPSQYRERIFEVFQRLHTREEFSGTGIGLAICKKIVERHEGRIWVESSPEQGATFLFTLPTEYHETD